MRAKAVSSSRAASHQNSSLQPADITVYSVCPAIDASNSGPSQLEHIRSVATWTEQAGLDGLLIVVFNRTLAPWVSAQVIIESTEHLSPLVALQPLYAHPFALARTIASLTHLYERRIDLNLVAGGSADDLHGLGDTLNSDERYRRLADYTRIVMHLLSSETPLVLDSPFFRLDGLSLSTRPPPQDLPRLFLAGSSEGAQKCAAEVGALRVQNAEPLTRGHKEAIHSGIAIKVGIITRPSHSEAWKAAEARFPDDPQRQGTPYPALSKAESEWQRQLAKLDAEYDNESGESVFWMRAFQRKEKQFGYLVGSYREVASYLMQYLSMGVRSFVLDVPYSADEVAHSSQAMLMAVASVNTETELGAG